MVHVEIFHETPQKFFLSSGFFLANDLATYFDMTPAKEKGCVRERWGGRLCRFFSWKIRESNCFIQEEWPFADKGILINLHIIYI